MNNLKRQNLCFDSSEHFMLTVTSRRRRWKEWSGKRLRKLFLRWMTVSASRSPDELQKLRSESCKCRTWTWSKSWAWNGSGKSCPCQGVTECSCTRRKSKRRPLIFEDIDDICEDKTLSQTLNEDIFAMGGWIRTAYVLVCCSFC